MAAPADVTDSREPRGTVAPGWDAVRRAFADILRRPHERGAGLHVVHRGVPVVDLYGGAAVDDDASGGPQGCTYGPQTRQVVFSASKGITAACLAVLADRGELDVEAPMVRYWPEFGCHGKSSLSVAQVLGHRAGLPAPLHRLPLDEVLAGRPLADQLARQRPIWSPDRHHGYHAVTWGALAGELVRRITGAPLGQVLDALVGRPLGLTLTFGAPAGAPVAAVRAPVRVPLVNRIVNALVGRRDTLLWQTMTVQGALDGPTWLHRADALGAELPAVNAVTTAGSLARLYAALLPDAEERLVRDDTLLAATRPRAVGRDRVLGIGSAFGCGFALPSPAWRLGSPTAFGHPGIGGAVGLADPRRRLALAFLPVVMPGDELRDPRHRALFAAISGVIGP